MEEINYNNTEQIKKSADVQQKEILKKSVASSEADDTEEAEDTKKTDDSIEEKRKKVKFIENPLPGPKPHVKKEMGYDYDIPDDKLFFDNDKPSRNYYDI